MAQVKELPWPTAMPDEDWAEVSQDIPSVDEPLIKKYLKGQASLIEQEKKQRSDHAFRTALSPVAKEACAIVDRIRTEEMESTWTAKFSSHLSLETGANIYPGMMFNLAKDRMEKTRLWQIVRKMPKGALLHAHMDAMVDYDFLFETLLAEKGMHIHCGTPIATSYQLEAAQISFRFLKTEHVDGKSIWTSDYVPNTPILLTRAVEEFPNGGKPGFLTWLKDRLTITNQESIEHHHGVDAVWRKFQDVFGILRHIIWYEPIFRKFIRRMLQSLLADGVKWVDLRLAFAFSYFKAGSEVPEESYDHFFKVFDEELKDFKATEEGKEFWGARFIWTGLRALDTRMIVQDMDACIAIKLTYPHLISGYDLVGQEDTGRPLKDILPELFWFRKQCAQEGVEIPFFFHAGETLGDGTLIDQNLFDAVLLGTRRIGHGFSLFKHPLLIDMVKERKILVESCPISNEVLRLCASVLSHPLPALLSRGVACSLSNDDPAILGQGTNGTTHDFWQALQGWDNLGLAGLGSLAENSVRWAIFEDQNAADWVKDIKDATLGSGVRAEKMKQWSIEWEKFCLWVITEFGDDGKSLGVIMRETKLDAQD
ncbi:hypothetical protein BJ878DRAFT_196801 [Calycina marina]|uniref:adenosine deaminase n=1 Tax=Calycina marina TaxID=1763456 RepID=A0A9P8CCT9_9HELO|nr:hypothetical protein BJ878DRAFT_196801 [Calycina marina]